MTTLLRTALIAVVLSASSVASAQIAHDLTVYSEDKQPFTLIVNGGTINATPQASVKVENTDNDFVRVEIRFEDASIPAIERKNLQIAEPGTGPKGPVSVVYAVKEKKGEHVLRFVSRSAKKIQSAPVIIINND